MSLCCVLVSILLGTLWVETVGDDRDLSDFLKIGTVHMNDVRTAVSIKEENTQIVLELRLYNKDLLIVRTHEPLWCSG